MSGPARPRRERLSSNRPLVPPSYPGDNSLESKGKRSNGIPADSSSSQGRELIASEQGSAILQRIASSRDRVWLVSPYVTSRTIVAAFGACTAPSKRLLTRENASDIVSGATDLDVIAAVKAAGVHVRVFGDIHAKVYVVDEWAYVGSANLTTRGLEGSFREFGTATANTGHVLEAISYFERVWSDGNDLTDDALAVASARLKARRSELEAALSLLRQIASEIASTSLARRTHTEPTHVDERSDSGRHRSPSHVDERIGGLAVLKFHDVEPGSDHNGFMNWRRGHQDGFYLTLKSKKKANLHVASCTHQGDYDFGEFEGSATSDEKVCAQAVEFLYEWAQPRGIAIHRCGRCKPPLPDGVGSKGRRTRARSS